MTPTLRSLRFPVESSRGRRYPELTHPYRNEFQRDRDRIVHTRAFRRLEDKTQVFTSPVSDHFRNRLTHTLEVSQIARTAASVLGLDESLTEALALAHDIGHPPFAHAGEEELNRQMQRLGDSFDHNLHSLRIVESFEQRYARFSGLNLTFEVREGIVKHSRDLEPDCPPELQEYLPGARPPVEAQLIDLADEIAYNSADLDDGYSAGFFSLDEIAAEVPECAELFDAAEFQFPGAPEKIRFLESLRRLIDTLASGLIQGTSEAAAAAGVETVEEVRLYPGRLAQFLPEARALNASLKRFLHHHLYFSEMLREDRSRATQQIGELFQFLLEHLDRMPAAYLEQAAAEPPHRVVCDYIAGMTDGFFRRTYAAMLGA